MGVCFVVFRTLSSKQTVFLGLIFYANFIGKNSCDLYSSPCTYPTPDAQGFRALCGMDYLNISYLCDPAYFLSRTEANLLNEKAKRYGFESCAEKTRRPSTYRIAVAIIPAKNTWTPNFAGLASVACRKQFHFSFSNRLETDLQKYSEILAEMWDQNGCPSDIFVALFESFSDGNESKSYLVPNIRNTMRAYFILETPVNLVKLGRMTQLDSGYLALRKLLDFLEMLSLISFPPNFGTDYSFLEPTYQSQIVAVTKNHAVPMWAVITGVSLIFCAAVAVLIAKRFIHEQKTHHRASEMVHSGNTVTLRMANQRWNGQRSAATPSPLFVETQGNPVEANAMKIERAMMLFKQFAPRSGNSAAAGNCGTTISGSQIKNDQFL